jgi:hypothetical protein
MCWEAPHAEIRPLFLALAIPCALVSFPDDQDDRKRCYYEIGAKGYKPLRFPITQLQVPYWWSRRDLPTTTLEIDGKTQELPVYEYTLVLEKR